MSASVPVLGFWTSDLDLGLTKIFAGSRSDLCVFRIIELIFWNLEKVQYNKYYLGLLNPLHRHLFHSFKCYFAKQVIFALVKLKKRVILYLMAHFPPSYYEANNETL